MHSNNSLFAVILLSLHKQTVMAVLSAHKWMRKQFLILKRKCVGSGNLLRAFNFQIFPPTLPCLSPTFCDEIYARTSNWAQPVCTSVYFTLTWLTAHRKCILSSFSPCFAIPLFLISGCFEQKSYFNRDVAFLRQIPSASISASAPIKDGWWDVKRQDGGFLWRALKRARVRENQKYALISLHITNPDALCVFKPNSFRLLFDLSLGMNGNSKTIT